MPLYYFDIEDGESIVDNTGTVFDDLEAVRAEALRRTVGLLEDQHQGFWRGHAWKMIVRDERRSVLFTLNFMAVNAPLTERYGRRPSED